MRRRWGRDPVADLAVDLADELERVGWSIAGSARATARPTPAAGQQLVHLGPRWGANGNISDAAVAVANRRASTSASGWR